MLGGYSVMDWVTLGGIITAIGAILSTLIILYRDNKALLREFSDLSKSQASLSRELEKECKRLSREFAREAELLSQRNLAESQPIKRDTTYLVYEMKTEKMARMDLYKNSTRAKEILETMDLMKEVVLQNSRLNAQVADLKLKNQQLLDGQASELAKLESTIKGFENRLSEFEMYSESEEIRGVLKSMVNELSELK